jgi:hypothetical protein
MILRVIKLAATNNQPKEEFVWDPNEPLKAGDYAMAIRGPLTEYLYNKSSLPETEKGTRDYNLAIRDNAIVYILRVAGDYARVRRFRKSTEFRKNVLLSDLKRVLAVKVSKGPESDLDIYILEPTRHGLLSELFPDVWSYLGDRLYELYGENFTHEVSGEHVANYNPQVVVANFLQKENEGTDGFMINTSRYGNVIFVNNKASNSEMIVVHEYTHQIGMIAAKQGFPVGDWMYEADEDINSELEKHKNEEMEEGRPDEAERMLLKNEAYFSKATEAKAHGEQMLYVLYAFKKQEINSVLSQLNRGRITQEEADYKIKSIENKPPEAYRKEVINKMQSGRASSKYGGQSGFESYYNDIYEDYVIEQKWKIQKMIHQELKNEFPELDEIS